MTAVTGLLASLTGISAFMSAVALAQEPAKETVQAVTKASVSESVSEATKEVVKDVAKDVAKAAAVEPKREPAKEPSKEAMNEPVCVIALKAKLRASPSTSSRVTWNVGRNMPLQRIAVANGWSKVKDLRGQTHWVISKVVSANQSCAVVKVRTAQLLKGSGAAASPADYKVADRYTPFKKVDREGAWVRLEDEYRGSYWTRETNVWIPVRRSRMGF